MFHAVRNTMLAAAGFGMLALGGNVALAADTIKIGVLYSMTGAGSVLGPKQAEAAQMAFDEANAGGGVNVGGKKMKIEVVQRDDETKPAVAISRATEMVRTGGVKIIQRVNVDPGIRHGNNQIGMTKAKRGQFGHLHRPIGQLVAHKVRSGDTKMDAPCRQLARNFSGRQQHQLDARDPGVQHRADGVAGEVR